MIEPQRIRLPGAGLSLSALSAGEGPLILLLHGFPELAWSWRPILRRLAATHRAVAPDQRGYALSDRPGDDEAYRVPNLVADILAVADSLGAGRFTLVGHDWGGIAAWFAAAQHPDRIDRLVIANAPHPGLFDAALKADAAQQAASAYVRLFRTPGAAAMIAADLSGFWDRLFGSHQGLGARDKAVFLEAWRQPGALDAMLAWYRAAPFGFPDEPPRPDADLLARPLRIDVPTLVLWGLDDPVLLPSLLNDLPALVSNLSIERVEGAGHGLIHERPDWVAAQIQAFSTR